MRWVGALRVTGEVFRSDEPIWGLECPFFFDPNQCPAFSK